MQEKWKQYKMYSYITQELFELIPQHYGIDMRRVSIFGHSMVINR